MSVSCLVTLSRAAMMLTQDWVRSAPDWCCLLYQVTSVLATTSTTHLSSSTSRLRTFVS